MSYFLLYGVFALWVLFDSGSRKMGLSIVLWTLGTFILGPIILPIYLACRPLKAGEVREGGTAWNILKNFAILWTIVMAIASIAGIMAMAKSTDGLTSDAAKAGAGIGMVVGLGVLAALWFFPTIGAALLGLLLKKNTVVETGPTGSLVGQQSAANAAGGWLGVFGVAVLGVVLIGAVSNSRTSNTEGKSSSIIHNDAATESLPASTSAAWEVADRTNEMDGTKEAYISVASSNEIPGVIGSHSAKLTIQCRNHKPDVVISVGTPLQHTYGEYGSYRVRVKFDDSNPIAQRWIAATKYDAVFSPAPAQLVRQLSKTNSFLFEFTPFERGATTVTFPVSGLKEKFDTVQNSCGLKL